MVGKNKPKIAEYIQHQRNEDKPGNSMTIFGKDKAAILFRVASGQKACLEQATKSNAHVRNVGLSCACEGALVFQGFARTCKTPDHLPWEIAFLVSLRKRTIFKNSINFPSFGRRKSDQAVLESRVAKGLGSTPRKHVSPFEQSREMLPP